MVSDNISGMQDNYQTFASFYDGAVFTNNQEKIELIRTLISNYAPRANSVLELGCGTGAILQGLAGQYTLTGLDLSPAMLKEAAKKVPQAELIHADMSDFNLDKTYDAVLCIFDSINHLLSFDKWEKTFELAHQHLNEDGLFIFDVNTINKLDRRTRANAVVQDIDDMRITAHMTKDNLDVYTWNIYVDDKSGVRNDFQVSEVAYPINMIEKGLERFFAVEEKLTGTEQPVSEYVDRIYFVCKKK